MALFSRWYAIFLFLLRTQGEIVSEEEANQIWDYLKFSWKSTNEDGEKVFTENVQTYLMAMDMIKQEIYESFHTSRFITFEKESCKEGEYCVIVTLIPGNQRNWQPSFIDIGRTTFIGYDYEDASTFKTNVLIVPGSAQRYAKLDKKVHAPARGGKCAMRRAKRARQLSPEGTLCCACREVSMSGPSRLDVAPFVGWIQAALRRSVSLVFFIPPLRPYARHIIPLKLLNRYRDWSSGTFNGQE